MKSQLPYRSLPVVGLVSVVALACLAAAPQRGADVGDSVVETFRERNGGIFKDWPTPTAVVVFTGELDGYIEPCGCTGKENQKGGLSRRQNFLRAIGDSGWPLVAVDVGNQVKRFGRQTEAKFQSIVDGLRAMQYAAVGFGPGDLRLPAEELVAGVAAVGDQPSPFVSANVGLSSRSPRPSIAPSHKHTPTDTPATKNNRFRTVGFDF